MPILREWRAEVRRNALDEYVEYVTATGIAHYRETPGNLGAAIATRELDVHRAEIVVLSWWTDRDVIAAFAGDDIGVARYYPEDDAFLLTKPATVQHYEMKEFGIR